MRLVKLEIENFRGIKKFEGTFHSNIMCLIGSSNSCKTTILKAINLLFATNWTPDDMDFFRGGVNNEIKIRGTIIDFPEEFYELESKYGLEMRGWNGRNVHDEPEEDDHHALTVELSVDSTLQPEWRIVNNRSGNIPFSKRDRHKLNVIFFEEDVQRHFYLKHDSFLRKLLDDDSEAKNKLTEALREVKKDTSFKDNTAINEVLEILEDEAKEINVDFEADGLSANLDLKFMTTKLGSVGLFDGDVPIRLKGVATQKLMLTALQISYSKFQDILLFDEFEYGLEPHRIRGVLRSLKNNIEDSQVFMTTHSPTTLVELDAKNIYVVKNDADSNVLVNQLNEQFQGTLRSVPEAFFGNKVVVCEGATEYGLCKGFESSWIEESDENSFGLNGISVVSGDSTVRATNKAIELNEIGYETILFIDSDKLHVLPKSIEELEESGIKVINWDDEVNTEIRITKDFSVNTLNELLRFTEQEVLGMDFNYQSLFNSINSNIDQDIEIKDIGKLNDFLEYIDKGELKHYVGKYFGDSNTYKTIGKAEKLGEFIMQHFDEVESKDLGSKIGMLKSTLYE